METNTAPQSNEKVIPKKGKWKWLLFILIIGLIAGGIAYIKKEAITEAVQNGATAKKTLVIAMNAPATDLSPTSLDLNNAIRIANIYEGLVAFDRNLKIKPALALSWGNITGTLWEFKLRRGVTFHDGAPFDAQSVVKRFDEIREGAPNQLTSILSNIKDIQIGDDYTVQIETHTPDPLLLSKLTKFYITKEVNVGTGPYVIKKWTPGQQLELTAYRDYWGKKPVYEQAVYRVITNRTQRRIDFENGKIDILAAVPRDQALDLPQEQLKKSFSLEINFLMFNFQDPLLKEREIREAIQTLFNPAQIEAIGNHFVRAANQFVAPGVYGFNPNIPVWEYNENTSAKDLFGSRLERLNLDYPETFETLTQYLKTQLREAGFSVRENALSAEEIIAKISKNQSQMFLLGWQAEDGDAGGFLDAFIHSKGEYNGGRYKNDEIDALIEQARQEMDPKIRLPLLQNIMQKIHDELIGIPLFEGSRLYAVKYNIEWEPRLDGLVLAAEVE